MKFENKSITKPFPSRGFKVNPPTIKIEILGTGCAKCIALQKVVQEVASELEGDFSIIKVDDIEQIIAYQVLSTPGLVINGEVKSSGKLLSKNEVKSLLSEA